LTVVLALLMPAAVIGFVVISPPGDNPYDLPQTLIPDELLPTTSAEVRSEAVVPTAAFTRVVVAGGDEATLSAIRALGYPTVVAATAQVAGVAVYHRPGFEAEAAAIAAALGLPVGSVPLSGTVTDADDQGDVVVVLV
jgi:hypothetical protein